jgi:phospholipid/cholesterol/gamma-HCH transport system substrate-binding protein
MSNEIKVALLAIAAILLSYWGYKFILGDNILEKSNTFQVLYTDVAGLQEGTSVLINGVTVGSITEISLLENDVQQVLVKLTLDDDFRIPKKTDVVIVPDGIMGGKNVYLEYDVPCTGDDCATNGDFLNGKVMGVLASMLGTDDLGAYMEDLKGVVGAMIDSLNTKLLSDESDSPIAKSLRNLETTTANLQSSTGRVDALLRNSSGAIEGTMKNLNELTAELNGQKESIAGIIANADSLSAQLVEADLRKTMAEVNETIARLQTTLASADEALGGVSTAMNKISSGEGTLGKLISDDRLYRELRDLSQNTDSLIQDLQERPYRYVPFKSRNRVKKFDRKDAELEAAGGSN